MATLEQAEVIVKHIIQAIVDQPEAVTVTASGNSPKITLTIWVLPEDIGKVIGKQGRTARSIRTLALAIGMKLGVSCAVVISETPRPN